MLAAKTHVPSIIVAVVIVVFSLIPVYKQIIELGHAYINDGEQLARHEHVMAMGRTLIWIQFETKASVHSS